MDESKEAREKHEDRQALKAEYSKLEAKYSLPDFDELNFNFEIENIDSEANIMREIMREMHETVDFYARMLENIMQPDSKLSDMKESGNMGEEENLIIAELYRKCMMINRSLLLANLDFEPQTSAKEIISVNAQWRSIKKELKSILIKMRDTWKQESKKETHGGYYG